MVFSMGMRSLLPLLLLGAAVALVRRAPEADARPEFARREAKACGFCHINPRGGGPRNQNGLTYARNEFSFPVKAGNLTDFTKARDRAAMVRARKLVDLDHVREAVTQLRRLSKSVKGPPGKLVEEELHGLDVRGNEILGQARLLMRGRDADDHAEAVELLVLLTVEYKDLEVANEANVDLKEVKRNKELRDVVKREQREAKARLVYLDGAVYKAEGKEDRAKKNFEKVLKSFPDTRAAKDCKRALGMPVPEDEKG